MKKQNFMKQIIVIIMLMPISSILFSMPKGREVSEKNQLNSSFLSKQQQEEQNALPFFKRMISKTGSSLGLKSRGYLISPHEAPGDKMINNKNTIKTDASVSLPVETHGNIVLKPVVDTTITNKNVQAVVEKSPYLISVDKRLEGSYATPQEILGLSENPTPAEIDAAYKNLKQKYAGDFADYTQWRVRLNSWDKTSKNGVGRPKLNRETQQNVELINDSYKALRNKSSYSVQNDNSKPGNQGAAQLLKEQPNETANIRSVPSKYDSILQKSSNSQLNTTTTADKYSSLLPSKPKSRFNMYDQVSMLNDVGSENFGYNQ